LVLSGSNSQNCWSPRVASTIQSITRALNDTIQLDLANFHRTRSCLGHGFYRLQQPDLRNDRIVLLASIVISRQLDRNWFTHLEQIPFSKEEKQENSMSHLWLYLICLWLPDRSWWAAISDFYLKGIAQIIQKKTVCGWELRILWSTILNCSNNRTIEQSNNRTIEQSKIRLPIGSYPAVTNFDLRRGGWKSLNSLRWEVFERFDPEIISHEKQNRKRCNSSINQPTNQHGIFPEKKSGNVKRDIKYRVTEK
jgi:hypothetical protein